MADALEDFLAQVSDLPGSNSLYFTSQQEQQTSEQPKSSPELQLKQQQKEEANLIKQVEPQINSDLKQDTIPNSEQLQQIDSKTSIQSKQVTQVDYTQSVNYNLNQQEKVNNIQNGIQQPKQDQSEYKVEDIKEVQNQLKEYYAQMKSKGKHENEKEQTDIEEENKQGEQNNISDQLADALLANFLKETRDVDRDNEVNRIVWAFKLNPYEQLNLRMDAPLEEVPRQYRKLSLLVHPDKCQHPRAAEAFEILGKALKYIQDDEKRDLLFILLERGKKQLSDEKRREAKHDAGLRLSIQMHKDGIDGVLNDWQQTNEFHEKWKMQCRELLARAEYRKLKLTNRIVEEEERLKREDQEIRQKYDEDKKSHKEWEKSRQDRVNTWQDFQKKGGSKMFNSFKMPKNKLADEDRLYVQRARKFEEDERSQGQQQSGKNKKQKKK